ncbi:MAG: ABC transporter ATP-binding protein [Firmicutes bacterium]|nr:ABC transporter ATP-binding protein [Bacillota bacterium]
MQLKIKDICKSYGEKKVLDNASYDFEEGRIYSILGRNGAGKTTLFNCISADLLFEGGTVLLEEGGNGRELEYKDVGLVSAAPVLPEFLTGNEFIYYFTKLNHIDMGEEAINEYFDLMRIELEDRHRLLKNYSFGMKNKIQLLCCLIRNPKVILLDEPLSSFDILVSHDIKETLLRIRSEHIILMATHIMQLAEDISDEIVILKDGKLHKPSQEKDATTDFEDYIIKELQG